MESLAKFLEAYETPQWAVDRILEVEILTKSVIDPCTGYGVLADTARDVGYMVTGFDIYPWTDRFPVQDFLDYSADLSETTVFMNPPFSRACEFVDHARKLGARKIVCFQRYAWRESSDRREWWSANPPARIWLCGSRATCWRFDLIGSKGGSPTAHGWFVWERGHKGAEITGGDL